MEISKNIGKTSAITLGDYILKRSGCMSHLKLQKILYYCEGYHLAYFDKPLITEDFEAWVHGPVCREVYNQLKEKSILYTDVCYKKGSGNPEKKLKKELTTSQIDLINDVIDNLGTWKGFELENATHSELPWIEARGGIDNAAKCNSIVSKATMKKFYKKELNA